MKDLILIALVCSILFLITYAVLKIESMTDYLGWLAIPAVCFGYLVAELAVKWRYRGKKKKERSNRAK